MHMGSSVGQAARIEVLLGSVSRSDWLLLVDLWHLLSKLNRLKPRPMGMMPQAQGPVNRESVNVSNVSSKLQFIVG